MEYDLHQDLAGLLRFAFHVVWEVVGLGGGCEQLRGDLEVGDALSRVVEEEAFGEELLLQVHKVPAHIGPTRNQHVNNHQHSQQQLIRNNPIPTLTVNLLKQLLKQPLR